MSLDIFQCFSRKSFFLTGGTGFMGKVFLYKLMKEFPDFEAIYILIRGKRSRKLNCYLSPQERLKREILESPCFDPLRKSMGVDGFKALSSRVIGVEGNITDDGLGLSDKDCQMILKSVNFIVHMAATVSFDERLDIAVGINTLGSLRVLALAKECRKLEAMVHVSTCYVNYNLKGKTVEECLYPLPFDPEGMCKCILALHNDEINIFSSQILKKYGYPNTYTFTKSMGEHLINLQKGNCPLTIVRPAIVGCSYKEPFPGWVDALTAAGGLMLTAGLGVVQELLGNPDAIADVVPVDFVVNTIIKALFKTQQSFKSQQTEITTAEQPPKRHVGGAILNALTTAELSKKSGPGGTEGVSSLATIAAQQQQQQQQQEVSPTFSAPAARFTRSESTGTRLPLVYQAATSSSMNCLTWNRFHEALLSYWGQKRPHPKAMGPMKSHIITSKALYLLVFALRRELPYQALRFLVNLPPPFGSEKRQKLIERLGKAVFRAKDMNRQFNPFTLHGWIFMAGNTKSLDDNLNERSRSAFYCDPYEINWWFYIHAYSHGLLKYVLKDTGDYTFPSQPANATDLFKRASSL